MFLKRTVVLHFNAASVDQPIVYKLVKDYDLIINILKAQIIPKQTGLLILEVTGSADNLENGIEYLTGLGISIDSIEKDVTRNETRCLQCGVCTASCPTNALHINRETMEVIFDVKECIGCEACVKICPPRAMEVNFSE